MNLHLENPFGEEHKPEAIRKLFNVESDFMVAEGYFESANASIRRQEALQTIQQYSRNDDRLVPYLAMNYFDRYFSRRPIPEEPQGILNIVAICCLTLALKMRHSEFSVTAFLNEQNLNMNMKHITRMELLILSELKWRMRSVTAICFLDFFISLFNIDDQQLKANLKDGAITEVIFISMQHTIKFTQFRPSIIAASSLLAASALMFPARLFEMREAIESCQFVQRGDLSNCIQGIISMWIVNIVKTLFPPGDPSAPS
ncbi:hypothetical protein L1049_001491 [Liquidambar formosana]|uniref:Cyclin N-terminal domain-containing protein n=1 Tax=Liquidambar formosana TaxID=63359 RepID=A0AAP0R680_LIQFO